MGVVSDTVAKEGGLVTGVIPYAMHIVGGEKEKTRSEVEHSVNANGGDVTGHGQHTVHETGKVSILTVNYAG